MIKSNNTLGAAAQKLKGKAQKAVGEYQVARGKIIKGNINKAKGNFNETIADAKLNIKKRKISGDIKGELEKLDL